MDDIARETFHNKVPSFEDILSSGWSNRLLVWFYVMATC